MKLENQSQKKLLTISRADESFLAKFTLILSESLVHCIDMIYERVFDFKRISTSFTLKWLIVAMMNPLMVHKTLLIGRRIFAVLTTELNLTMRRHVFLETDFILQPL